MFTFCKFLGRPLSCCTMDIVMEGLLLALVLLHLSAAADNLYALTATDIVGNKVSLQEYKGKVSLVVNVASECGYTDLNYRELVKLQAVYSPDVFTVLAFPCNQFGQQEPGDEEEIVQFAKDQYGVAFPLFSKVDVQGDNACAVYRYLVGASGVEPTWNFCKYLVDQRGHVVQFFSEKDRFTSISQSVEYLLHRHKEL